MGSGTSAIRPGLEAPLAPHHNVGETGTSQDVAALPSASVVVLGEEVQLLRGDADPITMTVLQYVRNADDLPGDVMGALNFIECAALLLRDCPEGERDALHVLVFQREGQLNLRAKRVAAAKTSFSKVVTKAESMVAEGRPQMYLVLQRYTDAVMCLASIWHEEALASSRLSSPGHQGSVVGSQERPAAEHAVAESDSILPMRSSHPVAKQYLASEAALLRCVRVIELGHHQQSDLLMLPLLELARIYELLRIYHRAVLVLRRVIGLLCTQFGYDHIRLPDLNARCERLVERRDEQIRLEAVLKLQSTVRMRIAMRRLATTLGRPVKRHVLIPKHLREELLRRNVNFLAEYMANLQRQPLSTPQRATGSSTVGAGSALPVGAAVAGGSARPTVVLGSQRPSVTTTARPSSSSSSSFSAAQQATTLTREAPLITSQAGTHTTSKTTTSVRPMSAALVSSKLSSFSSAASPGNAAVALPPGARRLSQPTSMGAVGSVSFDANFIRSSFVTSQSSSSWGLGAARPTSAPFSNAGPPRAALSPDIPLVKSPSSSATTPTAASPSHGHQLTAAPVGSDAAAGGHQSSVGAATIGKDKRSVRGVSSTSRSRLKSWAAFDPTL